MSSQLPCALTGSLSAESNLSVRKNGTAVNLQETVDNFMNATKHCDNLITVHRSVGDGGRGRRTIETSVNRGTIVLTVASWQAFVQDLALTLRDQALAESQAASSSQLVRGAMKQWETDFNAVVEKFSTPGPDQTRSLLQRVGFDPRPGWTWTQKGGQGRSPFLVEPKHVTTVINYWLRVRHDVAHGHSTISSLPILTAVRNPRSSPRSAASPTLRLTDAIDCLAFFRAVSMVTVEAAAAYLQTAVPVWDPRPKLALGLNVSQL